MFLVPYVSPLLREWHSIADMQAYGSALSVLVSRFLLDIFQAAEDALPASYYDSESKDSSPETGLEFQVMDLEKAKDTAMTYQSSEISSYPSHFTDSGLAWG